MESVSRFFVMFIFTSAFLYRIGEGSLSEGEISDSTSIIDTTPSPPIADITTSIKPLPEDDSSWETIRKFGQVYVDKTSTIQYLLNRGNKLFFFTRPRRFGKTVFLEMLKSFFRGKQSLFEGLEIHDRGNIAHDDEASRVNKTWIEYPVIHLILSELTPMMDQETRIEKLSYFRIGLNNLLKEIAREYNVERIKRGDFGPCTLIQALKRKFNLPVIILVDEYDAPINEALHQHKDRDLAAGLAKILNVFFSEIEVSAENLRFVWVTGITKSGLTSLENGTSPNSFFDVSLDKELAAAIGFTIKEMESLDWKPHLEAFSNNRMTTVEEIKKRLIESYDGYRFSINNEIKVFNPISVINCLRDHQFDNYWCSTASRTYIIQRIYEERYYIDSLDNLKRPRKFLFEKRNMTGEEIPLEVYMLLTGYLTIKKYNKEEDTCELTYANNETRYTISKDVRSYIPSEKKTFDEVEWLRQDLREALQNEDISSTIKTLNRISFPHYFTLLNGTAAEKEVTRRLIAILETTGVFVTKRYFPGNIFFENMTNIKTQGLSVNYVIKVKCGHGEETSVLHGIKQQIEYAMEALNDEKHHLLTLHFTETWGGEIDEWVLLPFEVEKLRFDKMKASSQNLLDKVKIMKSEMKIDPSCVVD